MVKTTNNPALDLQNRRSSSRSIKRRKFDDELVESSLNTITTRPRLSLSSSSTGYPSATTPVQSFPPGPASAPVTITIPPTPPVVLTRSTSNATSIETNIFKQQNSVPSPRSLAHPSLVAALQSEPLKPLEQPLCVASTSQQPPYVTTSADKKKPAKANKRLKRTKGLNAVVTKDVGRWKPTDDLLLILCVQQTNDLQSVHQGVKFSCKFTQQEVQERWHSLLYNPVISKVAVAAMKQLKAEVIQYVHSKVLFSKAEEELIVTVPSIGGASGGGASGPVTVERFQELLDQNSHVFYPSRTAKTLYQHWHLMKSYHLLPDQTVQPMPKGDHVLNFSDAEDLINDQELQESKDEILEHELTLSDRRMKQEIRTLENELTKWQVLVESVTGINPPEFDNQTLAVLRGRLVRYLMRSKEITVGRNTKDSTVDVDLTLEGPAWKISRKQGTIRLKTNGDFILTNEGKRPFYIDGKPLLAGNKYKIMNNAVVEIAGLRFIFHVNNDLINVVRQEAAKLTV